MWSGVIELLELAIFLTGQTLGGSLSFGILAVSATVRLVMLPLTYRIARRARVRHAAVQALQGDIARIKKRWSDDPVRLLEETRALYARHGLSLVDAGSLKLAALQMPLIVALFQAVKRVVIGSPLALASLPVALAASALATTAVLAGNHTASGPTLGLLVAVAGVGAAALTLFMGSGFGFYSMAFQSISTIQGLLLRRADRRMVTP